MKPPTLLTCLLSLLVALPAVAAPTKLTQQGRMLDGDGLPFEDTHAMSFGLFDAATGGAELWTEDLTGEFEAGYYSITLGELVPSASPVDIGEVT